MLNYAKGNLVNMAEAGLFDVIVHGCNCQNTMGSGIAKEIRERYPQAYDTDNTYHRAICVDFDGQVIQKLGNYTVSYMDNDVAIINAYTQVHYYPRGIDHFEYDSFNLILRKLLVAYPGKRFGFPYIGMGLAGGNAERIIAMLEDFAEKVSAEGGSVTLVEFG